MIEKVTQVINEWDPLGLFPYAPKDEYDLEIKELVKFLENCENCSVDYLGNIIYKLFSSTLGDDIFIQSLEECIEIAKKILT